MADNSTPIRVQKKAIEDMDFKELRNEVRELSDALAMMRRRYEDLLYNLDEENLSVSLVRKGKNMQTQIVQTEEMISLQAERIDGTVEDISALTVKADSISSSVSKVEEGVKSNTSLIEQTATEINASVTAVEADVSELSAEVKVNTDEISAVLKGSYTDEILSGYLTGIEITPNNIKMIDGSAYSIYNSDGLRFYDSSNQIEGWAIEPDTYFGGILKYYVNNSACYVLGTGYSGTGYSSTDMVIKALSGKRGRFVVDVSSSGYKEVKFVGLSESNGAPRIYANEQLLATQNWVLDNASAVAVFA